MAMVLQVTTFLQQYLYSRPDAARLTKLPDSECLKIGVIGGSAMINAASIFHPVETHPGAKIVALASRKLEDAQQAAKKYGVEKAYGSYDELLADSDVEAVYISLPNGLHGEWAIKSLQAGKHVLVEKPFTANGLEARRVFQVAEEVGKECCEAFHWQFHPAAHVVKALLASGKYGNIQRTYARMVTPKNTIPGNDIRWKWDLAGGAMMDEIGVGKTIQIANYALFILLCGPLQTFAGKAIHFTGPTIYILATWFILILTVFFASTLDLAITAMTVAVERDWVTEIADGDSALLTRLNTYMRRIDLVSKLLAPLFVSLLTTFFGYTIASTSLLILAIFTCGTEYWWIQIVFDQFPVLDRRRNIVQGEGEETEVEERQGLLEADQQTHDEDVRRISESKGFKVWFGREKADWEEFARLPIFFSSISIAAIYLTTLSFDGTFIAYIKTARGWNDAFIATMRAVCVVTGLIGTWVMPRLESRIGLERAGAWSIWFEVACLAPAALCFFYGAGAYGQHGETWNSVVLFGGIALSRIGLWSFDLCQLKELQLALDAHPRRNQLTALQISLQNLFDLLKYILTLSAATPIRFKWTALVSWIAVLVGAAAYAVYLRSVRGHLFHLPIWCMPKAE